MIECCSGVSPLAWFRRQCNEEDKQFMRNNRISMSELVDINVNGNCFTNSVWNVLLGRAGRVHFKNKMLSRLFSSKQSCSLCSKKINGINYRCIDCPKYYLCSHCKSTMSHNLEHFFVRFEDSNVQTKVCINPTPNCTIKSNNLSFQFTD